MKGTKLSVVLITGLLVVGGTTITTKNVSAQEGVGVSISPLTFELTANPEETLVNKLRVYNPTDSIISVKMIVEDFAVEGETGGVKTEPAGTETYSLARWIRADPSEFTLEPREQKFVDFYIEVPKNAEPGGHYGSILPSITGVISQEETGIATSLRVGSLVLLTISGEVTESLKVAEFSAPSFSEYGPINFILRFRNEGTVHVRPKGFVTIADWRGKKVADIEFSQLNVIPGAIRKITAIWGKKWLIGRFTATLVGSYGTSNTPIEPYVITFWSFPWKIGLGICLAAVILLAFFAKTRKRWLMALKILIKGEKP